MVLTRSDSWDATARNYGTGIRPINRICRAEKHAKADSKNKIEIVPPDKKHQNLAQNRRPGLPKHLTSTGHCARGVSDVGRPLLLDMWVIFVNISPVIGPVIHEERKAPACRPSLPA